MRSEALRDIETATGLQLARDVSKREFSDPDTHALAKLSLSGSTTTVFFLGVGLLVKVGLFLYVF